MDVALWIAQILLATAFLLFGFTHAFRYDQFIQNPRTAWGEAVGRSNLRIIGFLEILGAVGLILPAITRIQPWLVPLAAFLLGLLMICAAVFHARRTGEAPNIVFNVILGALAFFVAWGRWFVQPL
jgi:uncharacterized membrane protein YphA (DoxX/SURF4 family)